MHPTTSETLTLLVEITRSLHDERPLAVRLQTLFTLLRTTADYRDARLTCWGQAYSAQEQFFSSEDRAIPWDDALMMRIAQNSQAEQRGPDSRGIVYFGAPVRWVDQTWGVFEIRFDDYFPTHVQELALAIIPQLAAAIANEQHRQQHASIIIHSNASVIADPHLSEPQALLLTALGRQLDAPLNLNSLLPLLLRWALDTTRAEAGAICLVDHRHGELVTQVYEGYFVTPDLQNHGRPRWSWNVGLAGQVARSGRAMLVRDITQDPSTRVSGTGIRAELASPISEGGQTLAVLVLDSPRPAAFGESELAFVTALCDRAAQPLRRALVYQESLENSTQLEQVFTGLPTGLALLDVNGYVLRANPSWGQIWGLPIQESRTPFHVPLDLIDALLPRLNEPMHITEFCARGQQSLDEEHTTAIRLKNPTQELRVLSLPSRDSQGVLTGRLWVVSDVTREREVDRLKDEFVSIVSHELRTPLTSILGYTELLLAREFDPADRRQFVQTVYDQATHLSVLVEDLLGISRLDAGKVKLNRWVVAPRQIITELTNQLNAQIERHRVVIRMGESLPPVYIDRDKVKQILFNLLTNAIKYSPEGGEIELRVHDADKGKDLPPDHPRGRWIVISVRDQGIGISREDLERIWKRFYRVDNTNTRRIGGTGLGLSITRSLVELHGGRIWAESKLGEGSVFTFTLPFATDAIVRE